MFERNKTRTLYLFVCMRVFVDNRSSFSLYVVKKLCDILNSHMYNVFVVFNLQTVRACNSVKISIR